MYLSCSRTDTPGTTKRTSLRCRRTRTSTSVISWRGTKPKSRRCGTSPSCAVAWLGRASARLRPVRPRLVRQRLGSRGLALRRPVLRTLVPRRPVPQRRVRLRRARARLRRARRPAQASNTIEIGTRDMCMMEGREEMRPRDESLMTTMVVGIAVDVMTCTHEWHRFVHINSE
jgi:hypothetical protein